MAGFGSSSSSTKSTTPTTGTPKPASAFSGISKEYSADDPIRMPVYNSPAQLEAARLKLASITGRSGRTSTALVNGGGTGTYSSSFLGSMPGAAK